MLYNIVYEHLYAGRMNSISISYTLNIIYYMTLFDINKDLELMQIITKTKSDKLKTKLFKKIDDIKSIEGKPGLTDGQFQWCKSERAIVDDFMYFVQLYNDFTESARKHFDLIAKQYGKGINQVARYNGLKSLYDDRLNSEQQTLEVMKVMIKRIEKLQTDNDDLRRNIREGKF